MKVACEFCSEILNVTKLSNFEAFWVSRGVFEANKLESGVRKFPRYTLSWGWANWDSILETTWNIDRFALRSSDKGFLRVLIINMTPKIFTEALRGECYLVQTACTRIIMKYGLNWNENINQRGFEVVVDECEYENVLRGIWGQMRPGKKTCRFHREEKTKTLFSRRCYSPAMIRNDSLTFHSKNWFGACKFIKLFFYKFIKFFFYKKEDRHYRVAIELCS